MPNYTIEYSLYHGPRLLKEGTMKVKNKDNDIAAKVALEKYLNTKMDFNRMEVRSCTLEYSMDSDIINFFNNLFT